MTTPASRRHPEPEALAAFVEGALNGAELMSVTEHLSDCMECRALLRDAAGISREEARAAAPRRMSAPWWLAAAASIVIVAGAVWMLRLQAHHDPIQQLVAAAPTDRREMEPRLSGFAWAPLRVMRGGDEAADPERMRLGGAAGEVLDEAKESTSPESRHAAGVAHLLIDHRDDAIRELNAAARASNDANVWSDLAAAHYAAAMRSDAPQQFAEALKATDRALSLDPELREALFNRALILERLGQRAAALEAWKRYLAADPSSEWAREAREHLAARP
jgi:tetratricopeptide (TPR) repeat protein